MNRINNELSAPPCLQAAAGSACVLCHEQLHAMFGSRKKSTFLNNILARRPPTKTADSLDKPSSSKSSKVSKQILDNFTHPEIIFMH